VSAEKAAAIKQLLNTCHGPLLRVKKQHYVTNITKVGYTWMSSKVSRDLDKLIVMSVNRIKQQFFS